MTTAVETQSVTTAGSMQRRSPLRMGLVVLGWAVLIIFAAIEILPFVFTVANSFKCLPAVQRFPAALIPSTTTTTCVNEEGQPLPAREVANEVTFNPTLQGYEEIFDARLPRWFVNTAFFAVSITILRLAIDSLAGYALARIKFPGSRVFFFIILGTMMVPAVVLLIPRFIILKQFGILNTYQGLILPLAADAFGVFLMKQFYETIPEELSEAARIDGLSEYAIWRRIMLPLSVPALASLGLLTFVNTWNDYLGPLIYLRDPSLWTVQLGLKSFVSNLFDTNYALLFAGLTISVIPIAIIFILGQKYFVEGIATSGLKG